MKKGIQQRSETQLQQSQALMNLVEGWYFRCEEKSAGMYEAEGVDAWGRVVSATGVDPDALLRKCVEEAKSIISQMK
ncbi:hypothetical protein [Geomonas oryzae]|uniref:hypothetical protein n=1 Tax=Geomonas oryzae TaxID=2364273 RepID=UPI00100BAD0F|nr:hypothetical protein [Geomonas oryzae]